MKHFSERIAEKRDDQNISMKAFYLLDVYDWSTGETILKRIYSSKEECVLAIIDLEKYYKKELDYYIKEVKNEAADVCD